jgi:transporter family protein
MDWFTSYGALPVLALAARIILLGFERIVVKRLGTNVDPFAPTFLFFALGAVLLLPFVPWNLPPEQWKAMTVSFGAGIIYAAAFTCYVHSLSMGEASLVSPLYNSNVLFLALLAFLFLGEPLTITKLGGLSLLVYGASHLNPQGSFLKSVKAILTDPACRFMVLASLLIACGRVVDAHVVSAARLNIDPIAYCFVLYSVIAMYVLIALLVRRRTGDIVTLMKKRPVAATIAGGINGYSYLFLLVAMTRIDVSIAEPASMLSVLVTLVLARKAFGEQISKRLVAAAIMLVGAWLLMV